MHSDLARLQQELEATIGSIASDAPGMLSSERWSPAQIAEHLMLTYKGTGAGLAKCLEKGPSARRPGLRDRVAKMLVIDFGYLPGGRQSPDRARPSDMPLQEVRSGILLELQKMDAALAECERRFGRATKLMNHPFIGPLTASEWRKFHCVHGRHHLRQIRQRLNHG